ncbi:hypothetical protein ACFX1Q_008252 [Malus domestica]
MGAGKVKWPNTTVIHGTVRASDYCPVIVNFDPAPPRGRSYFVLNHLGLRMRDAVILLKTASVPGVGVKAELAEEVLNWS